MAIENNTNERTVDHEHRNDEEVENYDERVTPPSRVSWGAIFAGTAMALAVAFVLSMLGAAIGLQTLDLGQGGGGIGDFGVGAGLWVAFQIIAALFVGGWIAGRLAGKPKGLDGVMNGAVVWAVTILFAIFGIGALASNVMGGITTAVSQGVNVEPGAVGGALEQATQQAEQAAQGAQPADAAAAADTTATVMWWSLLGIVLGLIAACLGGLVGSPKIEAWEAHHERRRRTLYPGGRRSPPTPA